MAIINVKKDGSGDALTIQQGIQLAELGDTVQVEAGVFDENIDLWKGITLKGAGRNQTIITGTLRSAITARPFVFVTGETTLNLTQAAIDSEITTADYQVGRIVTASGIPANTRIVSKTATSLTLSAAVTSAAASRTIAMGLQNDASLRIRGTNGAVSGFKVIGFDHPTNASQEYSAVYFRSSAQGSAAANGWELFNCEFVADGEAAILADFNASIGNINIHDCVVSGKTFVGEHPAIGNQFQVWNVPRQLVALQAPNFGITFQNNTITGVTGGLTLEGEPSFNTAVTIDAVGAVVTGNTIDTESGTGFALRVRGLNAVVENNSAIGESAGYYILPSHANNVLIPVGTMVLSASKYWLCIEEHTSSAINAPTGVDGALFWSEITLEQVNESGVYGIGLTVIASNDNVADVVAALVSVMQASVGEPIKVTMSKDLVKAMPKVVADALFSDDSNWKLVSFIFKKKSSAQRLVSAFRDFDAEKSVRLKSGMASSDEFELHKIIISTPDRTLLVMKRDEIESASSFDFVLK
jgi:hypothetical protein